MHLRGERARRSREAASLASTLAGWLGERVEADAASLEESVERGLVLLEGARTANGFGRDQATQPRTYPRALEVKSGPFTKTSVLALLEKPGPPAAKRAR